MNISCFLKPRASAFHGNKLFIKFFFLFGFFLTIRIFRYYLLKIFFIFSVNITAFTKSHNKTTNFFIIFFQLLWKLWLKLIWVLWQSGNSLYIKQHLFNNQFIFYFPFFFHINYLLKLIPHTLIFLLICNIKSYISYLPCYSIQTS